MKEKMMKLSFRTQKGRNITQNKIKFQEALETIQEREELGGGDFLESPYYLYL